MNYSIMEFLNDQLNKNIDIFVYGSWYSTLIFEVELLGIE